MKASVNQSGYKKRRSGGADRYGSFNQGKQISPDSIAGSTVWIPFTHLNK